MTKLAVFSKACPPEVQSLLPKLGLEKVKFPPCPENVAKAFSSARSILSLDESTAVEELLNRQCRMGNRDGISESLESLMRERDPSIENGHLREVLKQALLEVRSADEPLELWIHNNGEYVFPEDQLEFFDRLVNQDACRMPDQEVDISYRTLRSLEDLARLQADSEPQRARIEHFLDGIHQIIDRKIQEFFHR